MPLWVWFGFLALCDTGVFAKAGGILGFVTMRWGGICSLDVVCTAGPARHGVYGGVLSSAPGSLLPGDVAPRPSSFLRLCGLVTGWGFLWGVCLFFFMVFHGECGVGLVNSVGLRGRLLGWGECAWAVCLSLVDASTIEG